MVADDGFQFCKSQRATLTPYHLALAEEHEGGDGLDAIGSGDGFVFVHIQLDDADVVAQVLLELFEHWMHLFARSAPYGKEINQSQFLFVDNVVELFHLFAFNGFVVYVGAKIRLIS